MNNNLYIFGEVLFDHFPDGNEVLGGAPFNVAWHLHAFGQNPLFISRVGSDPEGDRIRMAMRKWGMDLTGLQTDEKYPTGKVEITLEQGEPSYSILPDQAYDNISMTQELSEIQTDGPIYHGSMALRDRSSRETLQQLKSSHQGMVFMDVNLREPWWNKDDVLHWMQQADWIKLNEHELKDLCPDFDPKSEHLNVLCERFDLQGIVVTQGKGGATAVTREGESYNIVPSDQIEVVDTVGAGDAFASVLLMGLYLSWPLPQIMSRAQQFASALVGQRGATVQDFNFYSKLIHDWQLNQKS